MVAGGGNSLDLLCWQCHRRAILSAGPWPDDMPVPTKPSLRMRRAPGRMIWAQLRGYLGAALSACASVMFVIVTAERMRDPASEAEQKAHAPLRAVYLPKAFRRHWI
jgi:hypothetical protein